MKEVIIALGIVLTIVAVAAVAGGNWNREREGTVAYQDCREKIFLEPDNLQKLYKSFTCSYERSNTGNITGGICIHIDMESPVFSGNQTCTAAYIYTPRAIK